MIFEFSGVVIFWRGPAPFYFIPMPADQSQDLKAISASVTYGWGVIPVRATIGDTTWTTSLFPKDGRYLVPIRTNVRQSLNLEEGDSVTIQLEI